MAVFLPVTTMAYGLNQGDLGTFGTGYRWDWIGMVVRRRPGVAAFVASADLTDAFVSRPNGQRLQDTFRQRDRLARPARSTARCALRVGRAPVSNRAHSSWSAVLP